MNDNPKLRIIEAVPLESNNGKVFALRDPSGLAEQTAIVSGEALFLMQYFDGNHSLVDIRTEYCRTFGSFLPEPHLLALVNELDNIHMLENASFEDFKQSAERKLLDLPARPAAHAGISYPGDARSLKERLDQLYSQGAGLPHHTSGNSNGVATQYARAAIAPHIDLRVGGACYTYAYRALAESEPADVYVILGTGHSGLMNCFSCLPKDFETPLGLVKHDGDFIKELVRRHPHDLLSEPLPHRLEHTIEFQTVFLQHLFGGKRRFTIVPILCSYAYLMLVDDRFGRERKIIEDFVVALRRTCEAIEADGRRVCLIASADFSHVGPRYGDRDPITPQFLQHVKEADHDLIAAISKVDAGQWLAANDRINDRFRVCGFAPIHTLLAATSAKAGKLLKYEQGSVDDKGSVVSYVSAVLR